MPEDRIRSSNNLEYDTDKFRFIYTSIITPTTTFDYNMNTKALETLKIQPVNEHDASNYKTKRLWATSINGTRIDSQGQLWHEKVYFNLLSVSQIYVTYRHK